MDPNLLDEADRDLAGWRDPLARLRAAIQHDEFALYCQPIVALAGPDRYPLAEVLVRLREEERAMLPPGEFLPVFEHYRMMPDLDRWVVRKVLKHLAAGSRIPCYSVNLSGQTVEDADFPGFVSSELRSAGLRASCLLFEVDEIDTMIHLSALQRFAAQMRALGVGMLIDGFGRKSVSFQAIKLLDLRYIKVDGSIVRKVLSSGIARTKLNAILRVAEATGTGVIAECVEDQDVLIRLKAMGVQYAQGFGIYQPHPIEALAASAAP